LHPHAAAPSRLACISLSPPPTVPTTTYNTQEKASRGGWAFDNADPSNTKYREPLFGLNDLREVYDLLSPGYRGRCTAPVLVDRKARRVVNTESSDIVRMLNALPPPPGKP
jgi:putative glutathione S-transferase